MGSSVNNAPAMRKLVTSYLAGAPWHLPAMWMRKLKRSLCSRLPPPPRAEKRPVEKFFHGVPLRDDYAWLKAANWQEVLREPEALPPAIRSVIEAENTYAQAVLAPAVELCSTLVKEMRGRMKEDDSEVPKEDGPWCYFGRYNAGGQHPVFCRLARGGGSEETLLDGDAEANGRSYFDIGSACHSPDHTKLCWSADQSGAELYEIRIRDLRPAAPGQLTHLQDYGEIIANSSGEFVWMADSLGFYYVRMDENHRPAEVCRHRIGTGPEADVCVVAARDPRLFVHIGRSQSAKFAIINVSDHDSSESYVLDLFAREPTPRRVEPRAAGLRYDVEHYGDGLFIRTNADGADDFKIVRAPLWNPGRSSWIDVVPHRPGRMIISISVYPGFLVRIERQDALPQIIVRHLESGEEHAIRFADKAYSLGLEDRFEYDTNICRFNYSSMTTPWETYDYNLITRERVLRKRQIIPSGHDPSSYVTRRLFATAADGEEVPVSLLYRKGTRLDGSAPLLLYGYGAYGSHVPASFSANHLSLVDRGFIYAIAHVRGGTDKGWHWYLEGKLADKPNTFSDFIRAARHLIAARYTSAGRIVARGGSAGGMLMGAAVNMAPELFAGVIADVPFVDVLNTMLDEKLPLTPPEWVEWGNPIADPGAFAVMRSYSPYDNIAAKDYPPILALGGLTDPRVTYWEPLKWVAKLRDKMTGGGPILLKTNMGAGHSGAPGRFDHLEELALQYAFAVACVEGGLAAGT
jgi:oligopeptidase B